MLRDATKAKRVAFVIAHLGDGGAQRVAVNAANALVERGLEVCIITLDQRKHAYDLDPRVIVDRSSPPYVESLAARPAGSTPKISTDLIPARQSLYRRCASAGPIVSYVKPIFVPLVVAGARWTRLVFRLGKRVLWLRGRIKAAKPDAVLSFLTQTNILTVIATRGLRTHTVLSERNDPQLQQHKPHIEIMRRRVYRMANLITANSRGALVSLEAFVPKHKLAYLPNPLCKSSDDVAAFKAPTVITVGRLVEQKGLDVLLAAWARVIEFLPMWKLVIVGDGPLASELRELARDLNISSNVDWCGYVSDPFPLLRASKFFVLTSRFEGTPNALLEAMACGLPGIVSDASPGPIELIGQDERAGLIVPVDDVDATSHAILKLASNEALRQRLGAAARERARPHDAQQVMQTWLQLLQIGNVSAKSQRQAFDPLGFTPAL